MKRIALCAPALCLAVCLAGCSGSLNGSASEESNETAETSVAVEQQEVTIKQSPDKYTWYMKNYVGMNAASVGYAAMGGFRADAYGPGYLKIVYLTETGEHLEDDNEDQLKGYRVTGQSLQPNTEIKYTFQTDSNGEEYDNLVDSQNYEEIVLSVAKVESSSSNPPELTVINPAPDKYTRYVKDYVGRNLADCGYVSLGGFLADQYGHGYVRFDFVADDGSYIDGGDEEALADYVVTGQSVAPNTELDLTFDVDSNGDEYDSLVSDQSIESITLNVTKLNPKA